MNDSNRLQCYEAPFTFPENRKPEAFLALKNFSFHYVQIFLFGIKNKNCNYQAKKPIIFLTWLEHPALKILKDSQRCLKIRAFSSKLFLQ